MPSRGRGNVIAWMPVGVPPRCLFDKVSGRTDAPPPYPPPATANSKRHHTRQGEGNFLAPSPLGTIDLWILLRGEGGKGVGREAEMFSAP